MELTKPNPQLTAFGADMPANLRALDLQQAPTFSQNQAEAQNDSLPADSHGQVPQSVDLSAMKDKIHKIMKMDNLADITLAGYMIKLLRSKTKMSFRELHDEVSKCYDTLRRSDGTKYTGDLAKALKGCLTSSEIFKEVGDNVWGIREKEAKLYEEKTTKKLKTLINKKKGRSGRKKESDQEGDAESDEDMSGSDNDSMDSIEVEKAAAPVKKIRLSNVEYHKVYNLMEQSVKKIKGPDALNHTGSHLFDIFTENETPESAVQKFGNEKFMGALECFEYFYPLIHESLMQSHGLKTENTGSQSLKKGKEEAAKASAAKQSKNKK